MSSGSVDDSAHGGKLGPQGTKKAILIEPDIVASW
jgi:hypothetical protein